LPLGGYVFTAKKGSKGYVTFTKVMPNIRKKKTKLRINLLMMISI
jgi:hypothetical protein